MDKIIHLLIIFVLMALSFKLGMLWERDKEKPTIKKFDRSYRANE